MNLSKLRSIETLEGVATGDTDPKELEKHIAVLTKGELEELMEAVDNEISSWTGFPGLTGENTPEQKRLYVLYMIIDGCPRCLYGHSSDDEPKGGE